MIAFDGGDHDFPAELVERCCQVIVGRVPERIVVAVLRESGHAELVEALKGARLWAPHPIRPIIDGALAKAGAR